MTHKCFYNYRFVFSTTSWTLLYWNFISLQILKHVQFLFKLVELINTRHNHTDIYIFFMFSTINFILLYHYLLQYFTFVHSIPMLHTYEVHIYFITGPTFLLNGVSREKGRAPQLRIRLERSFDRTHTALLIIISTAWFLTSCAASHRNNNNNNNHISIDTAKQSSIFFIYSFGVAS